MHLMLKKVKDFDRNPFQYGTMSMLESRVLTYQTRMEEVSRTLVTRIDGNKNILIRLLESITEEFTGDLVEYMGRLNRIGTDVSRTIGMTSSYSTGKLFDGITYPGCKEIYILGRNHRYMWTDIWYNWRNIPSVSVIDHPITEMTYFMPGATNTETVSNGGLSVFFVDVSLLYVQWNMFRGANNNPTMEQFITEIVYPNMMKSHMDIVMLNRVMLKLGLIEECTIKSNLPFKQIPLDQEIDRIVDIVIKNISGRRFPDVEMYLRAIPCIFGNNILESVVDPGLMPTTQSMWANLSSKVKRVSLLLEMGSHQDYAGLGDLIARLRRTIIRNESEKRLSTRLSREDSEYITNYFNNNITNAMPK